MNGCPVYVYVAKDIKIKPYKLLYHNRTYISVYKTPISSYSPHSLSHHNIVDMKFLLYYCIVFFTISIAESIKINRLRRPRIHQYRRMTKLPITSSMCSASTCKKCFSVAKYTNRKDKKIRKYCSKILKLPRCCQRHLVVRSGDFL